LRALLTLLAIAAIVAGVVVAVRVRAAARRPAPEAPTDPLRREAPGGMDPRAISVGDVVAHGGRDFVVRGTLELEEGGFRWQEHFLDDVQVWRWLSVEDDEELELTLFERIDAPGLAPGAPRLEHGGATWTLTEHGSASYRAVGTTGTGPAGRVEYYDYAAGDRRLSFERFGEGDWEVAAGETVPAASLDLYPSSAR
jgi:hypothetical protein